MIENLLHNIIEYAKAKNLNKERILQAYELADRYHKGQKRKSGEPYIIHPLSVAHYLTEYNADEESIITALLHDTVEDTEYTLKEVEKTFGKEVANLIDGLTKFDKNRFRDAETLDRKIESLRKMFILMQDDIRIIAIKLFDRLHNLRTLDAVPKEKRARIAQESLDVYTVLSSHLGIWELKKEIEDICFYHLNKTEFENFKKSYIPFHKEQTQIVKKIRQKLLSKKHKVIQEVSLIEKSLFSFYQRLQKEKSLSLIMQEITIKILVASKQDCYNLLSCIHALGKVQEGSIHDYISLPQENRYRSLHTCIVDKQGNLLKFHIRTKEMDEEAEKGILTVCFEKKGHHPILSWLRNISAIDKNTKKESHQFWDSLKNDILKERIFVIGEKGKIIRLPHSSTVLDFIFEAYADEKAKYLSEIYIHNKPVPLNFVLSGGEHIKAVFSDKETLNFKWLSFANNEFTKSCIKNLLKKIEKTNKILNGSEILQDELDAHKLGYISEISPKTKKKFLDYYKVSSFENILIKIAEGNIDVEEVREHIGLNGKNRWENKKFEEKIYIEIHRENDPDVITAIFETLKNNHLQFSHRFSAPDDKIVKDRFCVTGHKINTFNEIRHNLELNKGVLKIDRVFPDKIRISKIYMIVVTIAWIINPFAIWYLAQQNLSPGTSAGIRLWGSVFILGIVVLIQKLKTGIAFENIKFNSTLVTVSILLAVHIHLVHTAITYSVPGQYMTIADISTGIIALYYILKVSKKIQRISLYRKIFFVSIFVLLSTIGLISVFFNLFAIDDYLSLSKFSKGNLIALLVVIVVTIYTVSNNQFFSKEKIKRTGISMMFILFFIASILQAPFVDWEELRLLNKTSLMIGLANGILTGGIGHALYFYSANFLKHYFLTVCLGLVLPFIVLFDFLIFQNAIPWGFILVFTGIMYTAYLEKRSQSEKNSGESILGLQNS